MNNVAYQYEVGVPQDYSYTILKKMADTMGIAFSKEKFFSAVENEDYNDPGCICIFRDDENKDRFVMLDTFGPSVVYTLLVRCSEDEHDYIKKGLLAFVNQMREEYEEDLLQDIENTIDRPDNGYNDALKRCKAEYL